MKRIRTSWINKRKTEAQIGYTIYNAEDVPSNDYDENGDITGTSQKYLSIVETGEIWLDFPFEQEVLKEAFIELVKEHTKKNEIYELEY